MSEENIKTMKLYSRVDRVYAQLRDAGIGDDEPIPLDVLNRFDQYHYHGTDAVDEGIARLALASQHRVLEVGSGLGGPARYIASRVGCTVTALELQPDMHEVATRTHRTLRALAPRPAPERRHTERTGTVRPFRRALRLARFPAYSAARASLPALP